MIGVRRLQPEEAEPLRWLFLGSLCLGLFSAFFLAASLALFLEWFDLSALPLAYFGSGVVGALAVSLFSWLGRRIGLVRLVALDLLGVLGLVAACWGGSRLIDGPWIAFAMVVCLAPAVTLVDLGFWALASRLFDLRQGKRLFGLVGAGEGISSMLSFLLVPLLLPLLGRTIHLLPIAGGGLVAGIAVVLAIGRRFPERLGRGAGPAGRPSGDSGSSGSSLFGHPYFRRLALATVLLVIPLYLVDFGFLGEVAAQFRTSAESAAFFGVFYAVARGGELGVRLGLAGRLVQHLGLFGALAILPALLLGCALLVLAAHLLLEPGAALFLVFAALLKLLCLLLARSLYDPCFRVLFQPLPAERRIAFEAGVAGTVRQLAICLIGALLVVQTGIGAPPSVLFAGVAVLLAAWFLTIAHLHREYRLMLLAALQKGSSGEAPAGEPEAAAAALPAESDALVRHRIEKTVETIAWNLAALVDLAECPAADVTRLSLEMEVKEGRRFLFRWLAQLHDPQAVEQIRRQLENPDQAVYALELLDLLIPAELKGAVLPVLTQPSPQRCLKRLEGIAPQQRLDPVDRLSSILLRASDDVTDETRICALHTLAEIGGSAARGPLLALLFHPRPALQEEAARAIFRADPADYARSVAQLPFADRERLDLVVGRPG